MRCVTFNIQHAAEGLDRVEQLLRQLEPDVAFLQEVDRGCRRSGRVDQAQSLARALGMHALFAEAFPLEGGSYGLALLSKRPLQALGVHRLPHPAPREDDGRGEPRILLVARSGALTLACTHLGLSEEERPVQAAVIRQALEGQPNLLLGGDLNEGREGPVLARWAGWLEDTFKKGAPSERVTAPPDRPQTRIDFVLRSTDAPRVTASFVGPAGASDHRPVVVDFADA